MTNELINKKFDVLDKGFVRLVDYYGDDSRILQTARVSYGGGTKSVREDKQLIDYLWRNEHSSPFEHVVFTFHCKLPIFIARQWIRHRTARVNEISGRYSIMEPEFYIPDTKNINKQSKNNKQGRELESLDPNEAQDIIEKLQKSYAESYKTYEGFINYGIARELARVTLPSSLYTEWYWQMDLKNLLHFLKLRLDSHAQFEIREYAKVIADIVKQICPYTWEAFEKHTLNAVKLSSEHVGMLKKVLNGNKVDKEDRIYRQLSEKLPFLVK